MRRRFEQGLCRECARPHEPGKLRCAEHLQLSNSEERQRYADNVDARRQKAREAQRRYLQKPEIRARVNARQRERYVGNRDLYMKYELKSRYGITVEDYNRIIEQQHGVCAICGKPPLIGKRTKGKDKQPPRLCIDHDHATGKIRGLLCHWCNSHIIAGIEKSGASLKQIAAYLGMEF